MSITTERLEQSPPTSRQQGDGLVGGALLTLTFILAVYQLLAGHLIPPLAVFGALFAAAGALVLWRRTRWTLVVAGLLTLLYLGGSVPFFAANLRHPESPVSFLAEVFLLLGLLVVLVGVVGGWRGTTAAIRRPVLGGAGALAAIAVVVSVVATLGVDSAARQSDDVAIEVVRSVFPEVVAVPQGAATLWIDNQDPFHHTVVIDGADIREVLPASSAIRVPVDLAPGTYRYWCDVPGHESMEGELDVR
jgi:plastocyanin